MNPKIIELQNHLLTLQKSWAEVEEQIHNIQNECKHGFYLDITYSSNTGNYDPSEDRYYMHYHCGYCDKKWTISEGRVRYYG